MIPVRNFLMEDQTVEDIEKLIYWELLDDEEDEEEVHLHDERLSWEDYREE